MGVAIKLRFALAAILRHQVADTVTLCERSYKLNPVMKSQFFVYRDDQQQWTTCRLRPSLSIHDLFRPIRCNRLCHGLRLNNSTLGGGNTLDDHHG